MDKTFKKIFAIASGFLLGAFILVFGTREFIHSKQLAARGQFTHGEVVNLKDSTTYTGRSHIYYVSIKFSTANQVLREERAKVSKAVFDATSIGDTVPVHYLAEDPSICQAGETVELRYGYLLFGILMLFGAVYLTLNFERPADVDEAAENIDKAFKTLCVREYEYRSVKANQFKHLDLAYYNSTQQNLENRGFVFVDNQENVTLRRRSNIHTMIRFLLSAEKTTIAAIYHFVPRFTMRMLGAKSSKVLDLETWFTDGSFVCTSNAEMAGKWNPVPEIHAAHLPAATSWDVLLEAHGRRVEKHLASRPGNAAVALNGAADILRAQEEMQRIKSQFRSQTGLSKAELERMGGAGSCREIDRIHEALVERRARN
jgi:hypothetical protein